MTRMTITATAALIAAMTLGSAAQAGQTAMQKAIADGGTRMAAAEITARLSDKTVTFVNANTGSKARVYYDGQNGILLQVEGNDALLEGFYATDLADHICIGIYGDAPLRLRCVNVVLIDDVMHKFELDGSLRGRVVVEEAGNLM